MQAAEATGFDAAWTVEHAVIPHGYQSQYPSSPSGRLPGGDGDFVTKEFNNVVRGPDDMQAWREIIESYAKV